MKQIEQPLNEIKRYIESLELIEKIKAINEIRKEIHEISPFKDEPVDFIQWLPESIIFANDYNPNTVAPPEMELLKLSIEHDGYTQPVVTWSENGKREVIDGFHRTKVCKEYETINKRVLGHLPTVTIKDDCTGRNDRMASTIRHNRARGKHNVTGMSDIVIELKKRNWTDKRIGKELGMDEDEVLRLCQISGLSEVFQNEQFSEAWESAIFNDSDIELVEEGDI